MDVIQINKKLSRNNNFNEVLTKKYHNLVLESYFINSPRRQNYYMDAAAQLQHNLAMQQQQSAMVQQTALQQQSQALQQQQIQHHNQLIAQQQAQLQQQIPKAVQNNSNAARLVFEEFFLICNSRNQTFG